MSGREQQSLALLRRQDAHNLSQLLLETNVQTPVRFVQHQGLAVLEDESLRVLQMIQQATGRRDQQVDTLVQLLRFRAAVGASDDDTVRLRVVLEKLTRDTENLQRQLARRGDDDDARAVAGLETQRAQHFDRGNQERQGLSGTGLGGTEDIATSHGRGDRALLDLGHRFEPHLRDRLHRRLGQAQLGEFDGVGIGREGDSVGRGEGRSRRRLRLLLVVAVLRLLRGRLLGSNHGLIFGDIPLGPLLLRLLGVCRSFNLFDRGRCRLHFVGSLVRPPALLIFSGSHGVQLG